MNYDQPLTRSAQRSPRRAPPPPERLHARHRRRGRERLDRHLATAPSVKVDIDAPHQNTFARIVGMNQWSVAVTATAHDRLRATRRRRRPDDLQHRRVRQRRNAVAAVRRRPAPVRIRRARTATPRRARATSPGPTIGDTATSTPTTVEDIISGEPGHRQDARLRPVHRPAQQRQPHDAVRQQQRLRPPGLGEQVPGRHGRRRYRSSTRTASSWAGRRSTSSRRRAAAQEGQRLLRQPVPQPAADGPMPVRRLSRATSGRTPSSSSTDRIGITCESRVSGGHPALDS